MIADITIGNVQEAAVVTSTLQSSIIKRKRTGKKILHLIYMRGVGQRKLLNCLFIPSKPVVQSALRCLITS